MDTKGFLNNWLVKNVIRAIILIAVIVVGSSIMLNVLTRHNKEIEVPDFTNMKVSDAQYNARTAGMRVEVIDSVFVKRMGRGLVFSQNPKAGSKVKSGRRILLTINAVTPKKVQMPNLVGYSMRQAKAELASRGLGLGNLIYVSDMATNNVLKQLLNNREIRPGKQVESGSDIDLVVGLNGEDSQTTVPSVIGMKYTRAVDAVHDNSLNISKLKFDSSVKDYSDSLDAVVYKQSPSGSNASVLMGSSVTLYLTTDPNLLPKGN